MIQAELSTADFVSTTVKDDRQPNEMVTHTIRCCKSGMGVCPTVPWNSDIPGRLQVHPFPALG